MARKSTKGELTMRREFVQELLLQGKSIPEVNTIVSEKYAIKKRVVNEDIQIVMKAWAAKAEETKPLMRNKYLERLELIFKTAFDSGNLKNALEAQKEINKISGLYSEAKPEEKPPQFVTLKSRELSVVPKASSDDTKSE